MPLDPELIAETAGWFQRAHNDLGAGRVDLGPEPPFTGDAAFHAQQAVEKSMKGYLTWHSRIFRKTHNLTELGGMCTELDDSLAPLLRRTALLTDDALEVPLPGRASRSASGGSRGPRSSWRERCTTLLTRLPADVRPPR